MKIDLKELEKRSEHINSQKHPTADLLIWNYNHRCQWDKAWDKYTMMARGLITDLEGNIVARPFKKFFNLGELEGKMPDGKFRVFNKMDGSLGILYWIDDTPYIATRGSFTSDQAKKATEMLHYPQPKALWGLLKRDVTYLFEIIYPENRIVLDYGEMEALVFLAAIDIETGGNVDIAPRPFAYTSEEEGVTDPDQLLKRNGDNKEGFVMVWDNGERIKVKFDEYVRLHRLITGFSTKSIWECLMNGTDIDEILKDIPDEFYDWVKKKQDELQIQFDIQYVLVQKSVARVKNMETRKEQAIEIMRTDKNRSGAVFSFLDGNKEKSKKQIWKTLKPEYELPFKTEI